MKVTLPRPGNPRAARRAALGLLGVAVLWELCARAFALPDYVLPRFTRILAAIVDQHALLLAAARMTVMEAVSGFLLGAGAGILLAIILTMLPRARGVMLPVATALNSVPVVAYAPLILLWFGMGPESKIVMVALAVGFTVFLHALAGLDRVDQRAVDLMRSFGADRAAILWRLRLPAAIPLTAAGMRVSTVRAMIVAIVTEMLGATGGLGWTIFQAVLQIDFVQVWSAIFVASAASLLFFGFVNLLEKRYIFWK
ncbi:ABC transporter permease [Bordetella genomosp. 8]|uniref:ABC transporter permease n=1 Tax=Bordetella genomosp. 8 TaxID=1416806 RepID=A0A1W6YFA8_9BORD|nr:ABC transporter permease [Bordetella genomosp. 8]ARP79722.1 ABC transporter permease [Bordetella genomosp. 8]